MAQVDPFTLDAVEEFSGCQIARAPTGLAVSEEKTQLQTSQHENDV